MVTVRRSIFPAVEVPAREREGWLLVWPEHHRNMHADGDQALMERRVRVVFEELPAVAPAGEER